MGLPERVGHKCRASNSAGANRRADQERAARLIMLGHM